jgi:hypothetical protein
VAVAVQSDDGDVRQADLVDGLDDLGGHCSVMLYGMRIMLVVVSP